MNKLRGDWFGLSFGAFLVVAAIAGIPAGRMIGKLLLDADLARLYAQVLPAAATVSAAPSPVAATSGSDATAAAIPVTEQAAAVQPTTASVAASPAPVSVPSTAAPSRPAALATTVPAGHAAEASAVVDAVNRTATPGGTVLQVAALMHEQYARTLADTLKKKGYPVFVTEPGRDSFYRVKIGPYPDRRDAKTAAQALQADGFQVMVIG